MHSGLGVLLQAPCALELALLRRTIERILLVPSQSHVASDLPLL